MKPSNKTLATSQSSPSVNDQYHQAYKAFSSKFSAACLALVIATVPMAATRADDGYMVLQYQFELSKKPKFRQLNLAYQEGVGDSQWVYYRESARPNIVVPLYSVNPRTPGLFNQVLFNRLDEPESEDEKEKPKTSIRAVLSGILGAGLIAAYAYATGKCVDDISNGVSDSAACNSL